MKSEIEIVLKREGKEIERRNLYNFKDAVECLVWMWIVFGIPDIPKD